MRDYGKVSPQFWIGRTGKAIRAAGPESTIVALYLMTSPHANMLGLYYLPMMFIAHETGLGMQGAYKGLQGAIEAGLCRYDEATEMVWVMEMARYQVAEALKPADLRVKGVQNEYEKLPDNPYLAPFFDQYGATFHMARRRESGSIEQAPCKPLQSQEQEQEHEQRSGAPAAAPKPSRKRAAAEPREKATIDAAGLVAMGVDLQHAKDWLKVRKDKRSALTQTALDGVMREAQKAGITLPQAVEIAARKGWASFNAAWSWDDGAKPPAKTLARDSFEGRDYGLGGRL